MIPWKIILLPGCHEGENNDYSAKYEILKLEIGASSKTNAKIRQYLNEYYAASESKIEGILTKSILEIVSPQTLV